MAAQRLNKVIASSGIASRRKAEELIFEGKITVNGKKCLLPQTSVDPEMDTILYQGKPLPHEQKEYYVVNKPKGFLCSNKRMGKQKLVIDIVGSKNRLFTVGRLDKDTSGLIIVTNDGDFANCVTHPSKEVSKEYLVKVDKEVLHDHLVAIQNGAIVEGKKVIPLSVKKVRKGTLKVSVLDGRKHEVRILCASAGLEVLELKRIRIGHIVLHNLPEGAYKPLSAKERKLFDAHQTRV